MAFRVKKSDPAFEKLFDLHNRLAMLYSPARWFGLSDMFSFVGLAELLAAEAATVNEIEETILQCKVEAGLETVRYMEDIVRGL